VEFEVHNLAKIKKASINVKNLTVFVGKNSTNKTYMAHIVYALNKILDSLGDRYSRGKYTSSLLIDFVNENNEILAELKKIPTSIKKRESYIQTDEDDYDIEYIREVTFDFTNYDIQQLNDKIYNFIISYIVDELNVSFNTNKKVLENIIFTEFNQIELDLFEDKKIKINSYNEESDIFLLLRELFENIASKFFKLKASGEEFYFPASRTGFVLAFDEIVSGVLRDRFGGQPTATKLTEPTIDFISGFVDIKSGKFGDELNFFRLGLGLKKSELADKEKMQTLFKFIETRIIRGKIIEEKKDQNYTQFYLQPTSSKEKLDLHLTSSATVELLPLVIFLKHFSKITDRLLVIEEPEAHLHPKAQIEMARLIVMLVNAGAKVLITTHSDYILNELSNCIKLSSTDKKSRKEYLKKYGLTEDTVISKEKVAAYLFKDVKNYTEVLDLAIDEYGISNDNFDDILDELLERTEEINETIE